MNVNMVHQLYIRPLAVLTIQDISHIKMQKKQLYYIEVSAFKSKI
jgi:hypothetical protein